MMRILFCVMLLTALAWPAAAQNPEVKFIADTLVVQAQGTYESEPDLATLEFDISSQDKELKRAYDSAAQSLQRIVTLADQNHLKKEDLSAGVLTVTPSYEKDRRGKAKSYTVRGHMTLRVHDFSGIGTILDGAMQDGIVDFRSLTYSLADEEAAKQQAVAEAMRRAVGRASAALEQKGQKIGALRYASLDVQRLAGVVQLEAAQIMTVEASEFVEGTWGRKNKVIPPPIPMVRPEKITVSASVQCAFQIL